MGEGAVVVEAVGHGEVFGVVGDGDVAEAAGDGGFGHLADGVAAVGGVGVHVEVAADVGEGDEVGEGVGGGGFELAGVFAELGGDVVEVEGFVDLFFVGGGDDGVVFDAEEGVLVEGEAALDGALAEGDVVHLGAGEVLEGGSVAGAGEQADVDLEVVAEGEGDFVLAFGEEFVDEGEGGDVLDCGGDYVGLAGGAGDEEVEVADGFAAAAEGAGGGDFVDAGEGADEVGDAVGVVRALSMRKRLELRRWSSMPLRSLVTNFSPMRGRLVRWPALAAASRVSMSQTWQGGPDEGDGLWAHAGEAEEIEHGGLVFVEELFAEGHGAGGDEGDDVGGHAFADAGDGEEELWGRRRAGRGWRAGWFAARRLRRRGDRSGCGRGRRRRFRGGRRFRRGGGRW